MKHPDLYDRLRVLGNQNSHIQDTLQELEHRFRLDLQDNFKFEKNIHCISDDIPLKRLSVELAHFQTRKTPYSEESVNSIIEAVKEGRFSLQMMDPIKVWKNSKKKLIIIAGHSRFEAFKRLSSPPLCHDPLIKKYCADHPEINNFITIPSIIFRDISREEAVFNALISNTLGTLDTDTERAHQYKQLRQTGKMSEADLNIFGKLREKNNRPRIYAYTFLNPHGKAIDALDRMAKTAESAYDLKKICSWIGHIRKKFPQIADLHENELFDWLMKYKGYGNKSGQVSKYEDFQRIVSEHIVMIESKKGISANKPLNILKKQSLPPSMREYYKMITDLRKKKSTAMEGFHQKRRGISHQIANSTNGSIHDLFSSSLVTVSPDLSKDDAYTLLETRLQKQEKNINDENIKKIHKSYLDAIIKIESQLYTSYKRKDFMEQLAASEVSLFEEEVT